MGTREASKKLDNITPALRGIMASEFCACFASLLQSQNKKSGIKNIEIYLWKIYKAALTASGLGFSYIHKVDFSSRYDKTEFYQAFDDEWIRFALDFGKCNYRIITKREDSLIDAQTPYSGGL